MRSKCGKWGVRHMINKALTKLWLYYIIIVGDFNTPLTPMDKSTKQKISKETQTLNDTMDQLDLIDIYWALPKTTEFTFFSSAYGTFSRIDHIMSHKSSLGKFKKF